MGGMNGGREAEVGGTVGGMKGGREEEVGMR